MTHTQSSGADEIARALRDLIEVTREDDRRKRRLVFAVIALVGIGVLMVGGNLYMMIQSMSSDMTEMRKSMASM